MANAIFKFSYNIKEGESEISAYDASEALYGISRSLSIITHYVINRSIIKQAPSLQGARVMVRPPEKGSFEFIVPVVQMITDPTNIAAVGQGLESSVIYDLTKILFRRLSGKSEQSSSLLVESLLRDQSGDIDALADTIDPDVARIHRPIVKNDGNTFNLNISGGTVNIGRFDRETYEYVKAKVVGETPEEFFGHIRSFNGSTNQGRFWIETEERTVSFTVHKTSVLSMAERKSLSWSLDQWVSQSEGFLNLSGYTLSTKTGLLKHLFITSVDRT